MTSSMNRLYFLVLVLILTSACSVRIHHTVNRFTTAESSGEERAGGFSVGFTGTDTAEFSEPKQSSETVTSSLDKRRWYTKDYRETKVGGDTSGLFYVGAAERLDFAIRTSFFSPLAVEARYQLLGDSAKNAKQGNFALLTSAALGTSSYGLSGTSYSGYLDVTEYLYDVAIISSYRVSDDVLVYSGPFAIVHTMQATVKHQLDYDPYIKYGARMQTLGWNFGLQYMLKRLRVMPEISYTQNQCENAKMAGIQFGMHVGAVF